MIEILKLNSIDTADDSNRIIDQIKFIFYTSSSVKEFATEEKKSLFFKRWCGDYISLYPDQFFIMIENNNVLGYLSGCADSSSGAQKLNVPGFSLFSDLFIQFPSHFHINFHPSCRGRGLGTTLVKKYCESLQSLGIQGVHLVTSPGAANVIFYQRAGFTHVIQREINGSPLLFMGKILD